MLQGLGRQLRNCGVDTLILENIDDHSTAIQVSTESSHSRQPNYPDEGLLLM